MIDFEQHRFGSAGFADYAMRRRAGIHQPRGAWIGTDEAGRHCYSDQQAAILVCGPPRVGKGNLITPWQVDGRLTGAHGPVHIVSSDWKHQNGRIAAMQVPQGRHVVTIAPREARSHHIDAVSYLKPRSPTLIPDAKLFAANWIPYSGSPQAEYFEGTAQRITEAVAVTFCRLTGAVTLPAMADVVAGLGGATEDWLSFEYHMSQSPDASIRQVAQDLAALRAQGNDNSGFNAIKNEIAKGFAALSDPQWRKVLSPPFDFCGSDLVREGGPPFLVNIAENQEFAQISGPIIRAIYTSLVIYKRRAPIASTREQVWVLDEVGNVGRWPMAVELGTYGPGYRIRPVYIVQGTAQLDTLAPRGSQIVPQATGTSIYLGARSVEQARLISAQLGKATIAYDDVAAQERARAASDRAMLEGLTGGDPIEAMLQVGHQDRLAVNKSKMARDLRTPDEIINTGLGRAYVFMPGVLEKPFFAKIPRYWRDRRDLSGAYLGDPFHSKPGTVEIATRWGQRHRAVITEDAPPTIRDWPQYKATGRWSYVKGFKPKVPRA